MPQVILRALEPEDLELLYTIENDPALWDVTDAPQHYSHYDLRRYIAEQPKGVHECGELRLVITDGETSEAIGLVDLVNFSPMQRRAEVSIALLQAFRHKGYGLAALHALEKFARQRLHVRLLYAQVATPRNSAALSLFRAAGYAPTAVLPAWNCSGDGYEDIQILQKFLEKTENNLEA